MIRSALADAACIVLISLPRPPDRAVQLAQVGQERDQPADRDVAGRQLPGPEPEHEQRADQLERIGEEREQPAQAGGVDLGGDRALALLEQPLELGGLARVGLHDRGVTEALLDDRADHPAAPPLLAGGRLDLAREVTRGEPEQRADEQREQRQLPRQHEQGAGEQHDPQRVGEAVGDPGQHQRLDRAHVPGQPRDHVAVPAPLEERQRQPVQVREHGRAQAEQEPLRHPGGEVLVGEHGGALRDRQHRQRCARPGSGGRDRAARSPRRPRACTSRSSPSRAAARSPPARGSPPPAACRAACTARSAWRSRAAISRWLSPHTASVSRARTSARIVGASIIRELRRTEAPLPTAGPPVSCVEARDP